MFCGIGISVVVAVIGVCFAAFWQELIRRFEAIERCPPPEDPEEGPWKSHDKRQ